MQEDDNRRSFHSDQRPFEFADAARRLTASHRPAYVHRSRTPNRVTAEKKLMKSMVENEDGKSFHSDQPEPGVVTERMCGSSPFSRAG